MKGTEMNHIQRYARWLEIISWALVPIIIMSFVAKWFLGGWAYVFGGGWWFRTGVGNEVSVEVTQTLVPGSSRFTILALEGISVAIFLAGLITFIKVLRCFKRGEVFSPKTVTLFNMMSKLALMRAIYAPLATMALSVITTLHNPPGQRMLELTLSTDDLMNILICIFFLVITSVIQEGSFLKEEHDLTV